MADSERKETEETTLVSVRFPVKIVEIIDKVANGRGNDRSGFIREVVYRELANLNFLSDDTKKALGILIKERKKS